MKLILLACICAILGCGKASENEVKSVTTTYHDTLEYVVYDTVIVEQVNTIYDTLVTVDRYTVYDTVTVEQEIVIYDTVRVQEEAKELTKFTGYLCNGFPTQTTFQKPELSMVGAKISRTFDLEAPIIAFRWGYEIDHGEQFQWCSVLYRSNGKELEQTIKVNSERFLVDRTVTNMQVDNWGLHPSHYEDQ